MLVVYRVVEALREETILTLPAEHIIKSRTERRKNKKQKKKPSLTIVRNFTYHLQNSSAP